jgi:hypothetical protein
MSFNSRDNFNENESGRPYSAANKPDPAGAGMAGWMSWMGVGGGGGKRRKPRMSNTMPKYKKHGEEVDEEDVLYET